MTTTTQLPHALPEIQPALRGVPLLDAAIAFATEHPECHDQGTYGWYDARCVPDGFDEDAWVGPVCGTTACIAGWIAVIGGAKITYYNGLMEADERPVGHVAAEWLGISRWAGRGVSGADYRLINGNLRFTPGVPGLPGIFNGYLTLDQIRWLRDEIAAGRY